MAVEALLRWNSPVLGLVSPVDFIPFLEEMGLISYIGTWVLEEACKQARLWQTNPHVEFTFFLHKVLLLSHRINGAEDGGMSSASDTR